MNSCLLPLRDALQRKGLNILIFNSDFLPPPKKNTNQISWAPPHLREDHLHSYFNDGTQACFMVPILGIAFYLFHSPQYLCSNTCPAFPFSQDLVEPLNWNAHQTTSLSKQYSFSQAASNMTLNLMTGMGGWG